MSDAVLGAWRLVVQYPEATMPPLTYWDDTIEAAIAQWVAELDWVAAVRQRLSLASLETAVLGTGQPMRVTISPTAWSD